MKTLVIASLLVLGACAPSQFWTSGSGQPKYGWVGCHVVEDNPTKGGSVASGPFGIGTWVSGDTIHWKQYGADGVLKPETRKPCE